MNDVFILGAGFSKAVSSKMPITKELSREVLEWYKLQNGIDLNIRNMIEEDFEKALTFLASDKPWLSETENLRHRALYLDLTTVIRYWFLQKSRDPSVWGNNRPPNWLEALIAYWHNNQSSVITLNYDTLLERVASATYSPKRPTIPTTNLYPIRLTPAALQNDPVQTRCIETEKRMETFKLFKLHGSINWFYSGRPEFFGEQLYFVPCNGGLDGVFDMVDGSDPDRVDWHRLGGKPPLIVPPTLNKSAFFQHESLRSMWFQAGEAIKRASKIVCFGYSLPDSDLTIVQFLKSCRPQEQIAFEIVDLETGNKFESKVEHFDRLIGKDLYKFQQKYSGTASIPEFVIKNLIKDPQDKAQAAMGINWPRPK